MLFLGQLDEGLLAAHRNDLAIHDEPRDTGGLFGIPLQRFLNALLDREHRHLAPVGDAFGTGLPFHLLGERTVPPVKLGRG